MSQAKSSDKQQQIIMVSRDQLPLSCPRPGDEVWNMHPRVYIAVEKTGEADCPYCGAHYKLED